VTEINFDYLMNTYLPRHGGAFGRKEDAPPAAPEWARASDATREPPVPAAGYSQM